MTGPLLRVENLVKEFKVKAVTGLRAVDQVVHAVSDVSFEVGHGQTLGLVGESGSGKSTIGRCVLRLIEPTSGSVTYDGAELTSMGTEELRHLRRKMQIVFQDPYASLDPRLTVGSAIAEPLEIHKVKSEIGRAHV